LIFYIFIDIQINIRFDDSDDQETFEYTYGFSPSSSNYVNGALKLQDVPMIIDDLINIYGFDEENIFFGIKAF